MDETAPLVRFRVARVVGRFEVSEAFYVDGLGLPVVARFADHDGWWGVVVGLLGPDHQLELTWHVDASPQVGGVDDLIVLWFATRDDALRVRAGVPGAPEVRPANPWWSGRSVTVLDPDGQRVTLAWDSPAP